MDDALVPHDLSLDLDADCFAGVFRDSGLTLLRPLQTFIALLRSEPRDVPTVLLPYVIHVLLKIANCADRSNWRARVHALNVLRSVSIFSMRFDWFSGDEEMHNLP
eukprot:scaffold241_cov242-Pinguiococcus_pyrenoidosus.AAC.14